MSLTSALANSVSGLNAQSNLLSKVSTITAAADKATTTDFQSLLTGPGGAAGGGVSAIPANLVQPAQVAAASDASCPVGPSSGQVSAAAFAYIRQAQQAYSAASAVATGVNGMFHTLAQVQR